MRWCPIAGIAANALVVEIPGENRHIPRFLHGSFSFALPVGRYKKVVR